MYLRSRNSPAVEVAAFLIIKVYDIHISLKTFRKDKYKVSPKTRNKT